MKWLFPSLSAVLAALALALSLQAAPAPFQRAKRPIIEQKSCVIGNWAMDFGGAAWSVAFLEDGSCCSNAVGFEEVWLGRWYHEVGTRTLHIVEWEQSQPDVTRRVYKIRLDSETGVVRGMVISETSCGVIIIMRRCCCGQNGR